MHFLAPHLLHLAWLALIPLALYLFRRKARRVPVSTLLFFRSLSREHQESAWLRRLKKWLSLLLTLLVLFFAILALARPTSEAGADSPGAVVLVVDRSASMAAKDAKGRTRLEAAREALRDRLKGLPDQVVVSLVAFDARPRVLLSRSRNRRECLRLLDEVKPLPMEGRPDAALAVVRRLAELEARTQVWHSGDAPLANVEPLEYQFMNVALPAPVNVGITGFQIRQAPLTRDRFEAFVKVSAAAANPGKVTTSLEVTIAGRLAQLREVDLEPGKMASMILPLEGVRGQRLEIRLRTAGDCLGWDDGVVAPLPQTKPLVVAWIADKADPFTELALASMIEAGRIEMLKGEPSAWPLTDKPDVYVFEHWLPEQWPEDRPVIALNPQKSVGPLRVRPLPGLGVPHDGVRGVAGDHPVLFRVSSDRLAVTQTSVMELAGSLEPLWLAGTEPVLAAGEVAGQRIVVSAFSPSKSEQLALLPAFPLVLGNALYWCAEGSQALADLRTQRPGQYLEEAGLIEWTEWDGTSFADTTEQAAGEVTAITRIGAWRSAEGKTGASILSSAAESDVPGRGALAAEPERKLPAFAAAKGNDWPRWLLWGVLGLLVLESFLFHRKAVF
jgi:hypothetical protein